jgi:hypothetical protein
MSARDSPGGEGGRCVSLTTYHPCSADSQEIRGLNPPGTHVGLLGLSVGVTFTLYHYSIKMYGTTVNLCVFIYCITEINFRFRGFILNFVWRLYLLFRMHKLLKVVAEYPLFII